MIEKKKKKNRIILCLCSIFVLVASIFSFIPLVKESKQVYADSVDVSYSFEGSNFIVPIVLEGRGDYAYRTNVQFAILKFNFNLDSANGNVEFFGFSQALPDGFQGSTDRFGSYSTGDSSSVTIPMNGYYHRSSIWWGPQNDVTNTLITAVWFNIAPNFIANIKSIQFGSYRSGSIDSFTYTSYYNYVRYIDINNRSLTIVIEGFSDNFDFDDRFYLYTFLDFRTYYLTDPSNFSDNEFYNSGYQSGLADGYNNGFTSGKSEGYNLGYNAGEIFGYNKGHQDGSEDSGQYTFLSLVSSVIDAPMTYFQSLFNFELLGVNLQGFLMALFTLCVVVTIIKLCLGG